MHYHHSTSRLFVGFIILILLGLAGFIVILYLQVHTTTGVPQQNQEATVPAHPQQMASSSGELVPGLESNTPPPVVSSSTTGQGFAR